MSPNTPFYDMLFLDMMWSIVMVRTNLLLWESLCSPVSYILFGGDVDEIDVGDVAKVVVVDVVNASDRDEII